MVETQHAPGRTRTTIGLLALFNPLVPIHLRRHTWQILDLVAAGVFVAAAVALRPPQGARKATGPR